jgi:hypothetical protein
LKAPPVCDCSRISLPKFRRILEVYSFAMTAFAAKMGN